MLSLFLKFTETKLFWLLLAGILQGVALGVAGGLFYYITKENPLEVLLIMTFTWSVSYMVEAKCPELYKS